MRDRSAAVSRRLASPRPAWRQPAWRRSASCRPGPPRRPAAGRAGPRRSASRDAGGRRAGAGAGLVAVRSPAASPSSRPNRRLRHAQRPRGLTHPATSVLAACRRRRRGKCIQRHPMIRQAADREPPSTIAVAPCGLRHRRDAAKVDGDAVTSNRETRGHDRRAGLPGHRRHLRLHRVSRGRRARPRAGHPRRPRLDGRRRPAADAPAGQARGRRRVRLRRRGGRRGLDAPGDGRGHLLRVPAPAARHRLGLAVRVQRLHPDPEPRPQGGGPPRPGRSPAGRRARGAARVRRDPRPPPAQERRRRADRDRRVRGLHGRLRGGHGDRGPRAARGSSSTARSPTSRAR